MKKLAYLFLSFIVLALAACGGGGGSTGSAGSGTGSTDSTALKVSLVMLDDAGAEVSNRAITPNVKRSIRVSVADSKGAAVNNAIVKLTISQDANYVVISGNSSGLTASGQYTFTVEMSSDRKNGAALLTASATSGTQTGTESLAVQTSGGTGIGVATGGISLTLSLIDQNGAEITSRNISQVSPQSLRVIVKDEANQVQPFAFVSLSFTKGSELVKIVGSSSGDKLTDASGQALFALTPQSVSSSGAIEASVTAASGPVSATGKLALQTAAANVTLGTVTVTPTTVQRGQSVLVTVPVTVNGVTAPSNSVSVDLVSGCGTVSPSSALVDGTGSVSVVIKTSQKGDCSVTASANGAVGTVRGLFKVEDPKVNSLQFVKADPEIIYQKNSPGKSSSLVTFKLVNTIGDVVPGREVNATLTNTDGGIVFCDTFTTTSPTNITDELGQVTFGVCAGNLPTTLQVKATLVSISEPTVVETISNRLTVQTGLPSQRFFDISASSLNIYAGAGAVGESGIERGTSYFSGNTTSINVYLADRLANPVPDGTPVVFVAEGGQINSTGNSSCILANGGCKVTLIGQEHRPWGSDQTGADPRPGRVTVLAYADGEEAFSDTNQNNRYDTGETFEDLGAPFIDNDENDVYAASYNQLIVNKSTNEQRFPLPQGDGAISCNSGAASVDQGLSVQGTCNGVWDGFTKVRRKIIIVFSGGEVGVPDPAAPCVDGVASVGFNSKIPCSKRTQLLISSSSFMSALISDYNGNPLPSDAALGYKVVPNPSDGECSAEPVVTGNYGNSTEPIKMSTFLKGADCSGGTLTFTVQVQGKTTGYSVRIP